MKPYRRKSRHPAAVKSRRRRQRYRERLVEMLGGKCHKCGTTRGKLEPHHTGPREWESRRRWAMSRLLIYLREAAAGKLQLLCRGCNAVHAAAPVENGEYTDDF